MALLVAGPTASTTVDSKTAVPVGLLEDLWGDVTLADMMTKRSVRGMRARPTRVFVFCLSAPSCHGMGCAWLGVGGEWPTYLSDLLPTVVRECLLLTFSAGIIVA